MLKYTIWPKVCGHPNFPPLNSWIWFQNNVIWFQDFHQILNPLSHENISPVHLKGVGRGRGQGCCLKYHVGLTLLFTGVKGSNSPTPNLCILLSTYCINASLLSSFFYYRLTSHTLKPKGAVGQYIFYYLFIIYSQINHLSPRYQLRHESVI